LGCGGASESTKSGLSERSKAEVSKKLEVPEQAEVSKKLEVPEQAEVSKKLEAPEKAEVPEKLEVPEKAEVSKKLEQEDKRRQPADFQPRGPRPHPTAPGDPLRYVLLQPMRPANEAELLNEVGPRVMASIRGTLEKGAERAGVKPEFSNILVEIIAASNGEQFGVVTWDLLGVRKPDIVPTCFVCFQTIAEIGGVGLGSHCAHDVDHKYRFVDLVGDSTPEFISWDEGPMGQTDINVRALLPTGRGSLNILTNTRICWGKGRTKMVVSRDTLEIHCVDDMGGEEVFETYRWRVAHLVSDNDAWKLAMEGVYDETQGGEALARHALRVAQEFPGNREKTAEKIAAQGSRLDRLDRSDDALALYLASVKVNPEFSVGMYRAALRYYKDGDSKNALRQLGKIKKLPEDFHMPLRWLADSKKGEFAALRGNPRFQKLIAD